MKWALAGSRLIQHEYLIKSKQMTQWCRCVRLCVRMCVRLSVCPSRAHTHLFTLSIPLFNVSVTHSAAGCALNAIPLSVGDVRPRRVWTIWGLISSSRWAFTTDERNAEPLPSSCVLHSPIVLGPFLAYEGTTTMTLITSGCGFCLSRNLTKE